ncbi:integrase core domain-containing protein [Nocardia aobensis]|uniref:integrase core domain-containing protein n=1 Tax=Nocardia aobensis TaxID=257277 RepID=UPI0012F6E090
MKFTESLALQGLSASTGSVGDAYDNALAESIIGLFKTEVVNRHCPCKTLTEVEFALMEWVDWFRAPRGAVGSNGGERPSSACCRGSRLKLGAA